MAPLAPFWLHLWPHADYCVDILKARWLLPVKAVASGGPVVPGPHMKSVPHHFTFGTPVAAYIQYCILKMWPPFLVLAPPSGFWPPCCQILAKGLLPVFAESYRLLRVNQAKNLWLFVFEMHLIKA